MYGIHRLTPPPRPPLPRHHTIASPLCTACRAFAAISSLVIPAATFSKWASVAPPQLALPHWPRHSIRVRQTSGGARSRGLTSLKSSGTTTPSLPPRLQSPPLKLLSGDWVFPRSSTGARLTPTIQSLRFGSPTSGNMPATTKRCGSG